MFYIDLDRETLSRYDPSKFMEFLEGIYDEFPSYFLTEFRKLPISGIYTVSYAEFRPDVFSRDIYGDSVYWQLPLIYNSIVQIDELIIGKILNYPSMSDVEDLYFKLPALSLRAS